MVYYIFGFKFSIRALKNCQKSWRTLVRPDISSTFCQFELISGWTNVLDPVCQLQKNWVSCFRCNTLGTTYIYSLKTISSLYIICLPATTHSTHNEIILTLSYLRPQLKWFFRGRGYKSRLQKDFLKIIL